MLVNLSKSIDETGACTSIKDAAFPAPFVSGLEYNSPARGNSTVTETLVKFIKL